MKSGAWRLEEELRDPQTEVKLMTEKPQVNLCSGTTGGTKGPNGHSGVDDKHLVLD